MAKKSTGLWIDEELIKKVNYLRLLENRSWNQMAAILIERGLEAQPAEVDELVTALREIVKIAEVVEPYSDSEHAENTAAIERAQAALAPFEGVSK